MTVTDGAVGIGTDSPGSKLTVSGPSNAASNTPSQAIVDIVGSSTAHLLMGTASASPYGAWINTDATGQPLILQGPGGNVGIGIATPSKLLHLLGADATVQIQGSGTSSNAGVDFFPRDGSNVAHLQSIKGVGSSLTFLTGGNSGNSYVPTERMRIDSGGSVIIGAGPTSGTPSADYRSLEIGRQGNTITGAPWKSNLYFSTNATITAGSTTFTARYLNELPMQYVMEDGIFTWSNAVAPTAVGDTVSFNERMRINAAGDVGIFVTNPGARLEVKAGTTYVSNTDLGIKITNAGHRGSELNTFGEGSYLTHYFENYAGGSGRAYDRALEIVCKGQPDGTYGEGIIKFKANPITAGSNVAEIMRITGSGNVGIGTTSPTNGKLDVRGRLLVNGTGTNDGFGSEQTLTIKKVLGNNGVATKVAVVGHTHALQITAVVYQTGSSGCTATGISTSFYGFGTTGFNQVNSAGSGVITNISLAYLNTNPSGTNYVLTVTPTFTSGAPPTCYLTIRGQSDQYMVVYTT